jgi:hypothetical protein
MMSIGSKNYYMFKNESHTSIESECLILNIPNKPNNNEYEYIRGLIPSSLKPDTSSRNSILFRCNGVITTLNFYGNKLDRVALAQI